MTSGPGLPALKTDLTFSLYPVPAGVVAGIVPTMMGVKKSERVPITGEEAVNPPLASDNTSSKILVNGKSPSVVTCTEILDPGA